MRRSPFFQTPATIFAWVRRGKFARHMPRRIEEKRSFKNIGEHPKVVLDFYIILEGEDVQKAQSTLPDSLVMSSSSGSLLHDFM